MWVKVIFIFLAFNSQLAYSSQMCVPNYFKVVSKKFDVPEDVVYSLALQESAVKMNNGKVLPWPYSANYAGETFLYRNYEDMVASISKMVSSGKTAVDVGYFQVNWKWHKDKAKTVVHLSHPSINARVAMGILKNKYSKYGDWVVAAGRYHNPFNNKGKADRYAERYGKWLHRVRNGYGC
ncbi:transglycosylase SLT domain-containing protein [Vibrio owensii]|uniref:transglycosylase SLT domain-containing protein n=1 Tax=Vibrio owensii TaxID=696485 RepID=UPI0018F23D1C|nr:transglycosylase SLT domain-containing protein [Vibrio owensii]